MTKDRRDRDFDGANVRAGAAEGGGIRELARGPGAQHLGREDRADRPGDKPAIGKSTHVLIDRTDIRAGAAADAFEHLTPDRIFKHLRATVVEKDKMEFFWTELTLFPARTRDDLCLGGKFLSSGRAGKQFQENSQ